MSADFNMAAICLQENLRLLDGNPTLEATGLWNVSNALLVICDALAEIDVRLKQVETSRK